MRCTMIRGHAYTSVVSIKEWCLWCAVVKQMVGEIIPTRVQLTFSQCQNYIADISAERNYTYSFWGHADVALQASSPDQTFAEEVRSSLLTPRSGMTYADAVAIRPAMVLHMDT